METTIVRRQSGVIERPIAEVRAQFHDMRYHVQQNVHPDLTFTLHESAGGKCAFSQTITLAGMRQTDEIVNTRLPGGDLRSDFVEGMNRGGTLVVRFLEAGTGCTMVKAELQIPVRGAKVLLAPLLAAAAQAALAKAFAQDKADLEAGNYARYSDRQSTAV